jgi:hypothetical protein
MSAFDKPYSAVPVVKGFGPLLPQFKPRQDEQYSLVMREIESDQIGNLVEAAATCVYSKIVHIHTTRSLKAGGSSFHYDPKLTCSGRLTRCVEAIEKLAIIRHDVITNTRILELIANPAWMMDRKEENKIQNDTKSRETGEAKEAKKYQKKSLKNSSDSKEENEVSGASKVSMGGSGGDEELVTDSGGPDSRPSSV